MELMKTHALFQLLISLLVISVINNLCRLEIVQLTCHAKELTLLWTILRHSAQALWLWMQPSWACNP